MAEVMMIYRCDVCHAVRLFTQDEQIGLEVREWQCGSGRPMDPPYCPGTVSRFATVKANEVTHG